MAASASIAMSVKDNLSAAVAGMRNSLTGMRGDATALQGELDRLNATKVSLKMELDKTAQQAREAKKAFLDLGESASEAEREAAKADWTRAEANLENIRQQYSLVSKQVRETTKDFEEASGAIVRAGNRAGSSGGGTEEEAVSVLSALGQAGILSMAGGVAGDWANTLIGSAFGSEAGGLISGGLSGALSGAAMGSLAGPAGTAVGAAVGGALGLLGGGNQAVQARDEAFKSYYGGLYDTQTAARQESLTSGSTMAASREMNLSALTTLLDGDAEAAGRFHNELIEIGRTPPFSYDLAAEMSKSMLGLGLSTDQVTDRIAALGEAAAALDLSSSGVNTIISALETAQISGKLESRVLKSLSKQGVNVYGALAEEFGISESDVAANIGDMDVERAVDAVYRYMGTAFAGAADGLTNTFSGASGIVDSLFEDISSAMGAGYNDERLGGLQAQISAYGGALGDAMMEVNRVIGENAAYLDSLQEQFAREALSAVLLGEGTSLYGADGRSQLSGMRDAYLAASAEYDASGSREAALKMQELTAQAQAVAQAAFESSDAYKMAQDAQADSLSALRDNTSALEAATAAYNLAEERTKGAGAALFQADQASALSRIGSLADPELAGAVSGSLGFAVKANASRSHAAGLRRVPYDNYAALLHEGERVLPASAVQEESGPQSFTVNVTGNTFGAGMDAEAVAEALADRIALQLAAGNRGAYA